MKYVRKRLLAAATRAREAGLAEHARRTEAWERGVADSKKEWRDRNAEQWTSDLYRLLDKVRSGGVIDRNDLLTMNHLERGDGVKLPPTWPDSKSPKLPKEPVKNYQPDPIYDRIISLCNMIEDTTISTNSLQQAGFGQADMAKILSLVARYDADGEEPSA